MQKFLYSLFTTLYPFIIRLLTPFNEKAKLWFNGRKKIFEKIQASIIGKEPLIWIHCSSLGEFEQGRPVIEKLRISYPGYKILITFFSPSGYEVRKDYAGADYIFYLPMDSRANARQFLDLVKPTLIIFVKYEFWYHYLDEAKQRNIPLLLISAIFRQSQPFFKRYGQFHRYMLSCFSHIFIQNPASLFLLESIGLKDKISITGDTRFDRVIEIAEQFKPVMEIETFCAGSAVIVAGSTWTEDDKELAHYANSNISARFIIAPHSIIKDRIKECLRLYKHAQLFSAIGKSGIPAGVNTIIIDNIGMLSSLYKYGTVAYVGGGFGADGVHNVLEAAVYGKPVVFGPEYQKFLEAEELVQSGGGVSVENTLKLEETFNKLLLKDDNYEAACNASLEYVLSKKGSTEKIMRYIQEKRLLTS